LQHFTENTEAWEREEAMLQVTDVVLTLVGQVLESQSEPRREDIRLLLTKIRPFTIEDRLRLGRALRKIL